MTTPKNHRLSVLVPAFNEEATIATVIKQLLALPVVSEIIVVDDGSTDRTSEIMQSLKDDRILYFRQPRNAGKTAAIRKALEMATGDIAIIQDADLEYDPTEIPVVIKPILDNKADVVYGSRFLVRGATRVIYFSHFVANKFLTNLCNCFTNLNMTDIETGYKAFRIEYIKGIPLTSHGFGMEIEITAMMGKLPIRIYEVPISYYGRTYAEGKKIGAWDGILAIYYILYYNVLGKLLPKHRQYLHKALDAAMRTQA